MEEDRYWRELPAVIERVTGYLAALEGKIDGMLTPDAEGSLTVAPADRRSLASLQTEHARHARYVARLRGKMALHHAELAEQRQYEQLRHRLGFHIHPVRLCRLPTWFKEAILTAYGRPPPNRQLLDLSLFRRSWMANFGTSYPHSYDRNGFECERGPELMVAEPFSFTADDREDVEATAERLGCDWNWSSESWHWPHRALRIIFSP